MSGPNMEDNGMDYDHGTPPKTYLLDDAARMVEQFMADLDTHATKCECCGMNRYRNKPENDMHRQLGGVVAKLVKVRDEARARLRNR